MRRNTPARAKQEREYRALRVEFLTANPQCQCPIYCGSPATEVHHKRGRRGALLLAVEHWAALCSACHQHWTVNPSRAYELGISERRVGA